jgi:hypothetical protein
MKARAQILTTTANDHKSNRQQQGDNAQRHVMPNDLSSAKQRERQRRSTPG